MGFSEQLPVVTGPAGRQQGTAKHNNPWGPGKRSHPTTPSPHPTSCPLLPFRRGGMLKPYTVNELHEQCLNHEKRKLRLYCTLGHRRLLAMVYTKGTSGTNDSVTGMGRQAAKRTDRHTPTHSCSSRSTHTHNLEVPIAYRIYTCLWFFYLHLPTADHRGRVFSLSHAFSILLCFIF